MKMISNTSMTSTSGTTLISASDVATCAPRPRLRPPPPPPCCTFGMALREVPLADVQELEREVVHRRGELFHPLREEVVEIHCGDRREESCRRRNQRFSDARRNDV